MSTNCKQLLMLLILAAPAVHADLPTTLSVRCTLTPSSVFDTSNCDGDDGTAAIPLSWATVPNQVVTSGASYSVNLRTGYLTEAGSPDATLSILGCTLPSGWSLGADSLAYSGSGTGTAQCRVRATRTAVTSDTNEFTVSAEAAVLGESLVEYQIGSFEPVPSTSRTVNSYTLTSAGTGFAGVADQGIFRGIEISGDFTITARVASLTDNSQPFPQAGLMVRESLSAASPAMTIAASVTGVGARCRARTTTGGSLSSLALDAAFVVPDYLRLYRNGNDFTCSESTDGTTWVDMATQTIAMADSVYIGAMASSQSGTAISTTIDTVVIDEAAPSTGGGGTPGAKKWHPGHYHKTQGPWNATGYCATVTSQLTRATESTHLRGEWVAYAWGAIETTDGVYDWSCVDAHIAYLASVGKYLIADLAYKAFSPSPGNIVPADLTSRVVTGTGTQPVQIAPIWEADVADRYIRFLEAFAARYDSNPTVELVQMSESAPSFGGGNPSATYSTSALATQLKRVYSAAAAAFDQTVFAPMVNSLSNQAAGLIEHAYSLGLGVGSPDAFTVSANGDLDAGSLIFSGTQVAGQGTTVRDYRGLIPHEVKGSDPVLGGKDDNGPATNLIDWAQTHDVTHMSWISSVTRTGNTWSAILSAIAADPLLFTACPSAITCQ